MLRRCGALHETLQDSLGLTCPERPTNIAVARNLCHEGSGTWVKHSKH